MRLFKRPWGHEEIWAETPRYLGKFLYVDPGCVVDKHYHDIKTKTVCVIDGKITLEIMDNDGSSSSRDLTRGETFHVSPKTIHRLRCADRGAVLVEVSTPELDDVVILENYYG